VSGCFFSEHSVVELQGYYMKTQQPCIWLCSSKGHTATEPTYKRCCYG